MKAEIIAVGSELLTPDRVDTNSLFLTARLNQLGIEVTRKTVVGDDLAPLRDAFDEAAKRAELVIASGGLGPTEDDRTRDAVADLLGRKLARDPAVMSKIEARFRQLGRSNVGSERAPGHGPRGRRRSSKTIAAPRRVCGSSRAAASSFCFPARRTN